MSRKSYSFRATILFALSLWFVLLEASRASAQQNADEKPPNQNVPEQPGVPAQPAGKRIFKAAAAISPVRVDGILDEPAWSSATVVGVDLEWFPGDNAPSAVTTECLVLYDRDNLYIAFRARDPDPTDIRAHLADRDTPFLDDTVGLLIDPFNDERRAFQFRINALGVQMDATNSDVDDLEDWSWDAIWDSAGRITDGGYDVEVRIPFTSLRFPRTPGVQTWGFMAMRDYPRSTRHRMRSMRTDRNRNCLICQFDKLTGFEGITPGRNVELDPTVTAARTDVRSYPEIGQNEPSRNQETDAGLSARWGITPNLSLNGALNPDFNGVEADAAQLDVNNRFALFFPEKRPLFLEGADFFSTLLPAVFTRTVADPAGAIKLTGKEGRSAIGVFAARDRENDLIFPSNQFSVFARFEDQKVNSGVFRYRHDVGKTSTLGVLYTGRDGDGYANRAWGVDGSIRASESDTIRFQYLRSRTDYPDDVATAFLQPEGAFRGDALAVSYNHRTRNWDWGVHWQDLGPNFRADSGFIDRVDTRTAAAGLGRTFWGGTGSWFNEIRISASADVTEDHEGRRTDEGQDLEFSYQGPLQTVVELAISPNREAFNGVTYDNFRQSAYFETRPHGSFYFHLFGNWGETIDFANALAAGFGTERQAEFVTVNPGASLNIGRHFAANIDHVSQRLTVGGDHLLTARLTQSRLLYHFSKRTFVRLILQYEAVERNPDVYLFPVTSNTRSLFSQFLFSYKINPQTLVLVGYSDNSLGFDGVRLRQTDRSLFLKVGYAWVL